MKDKKESPFVNPIDPDKITENPSTLPYAHTVGGAVIKPTKQGVIRSKSLMAMEEQTDMQLMQIKEQIDLLAQQAKAIQDRKDLAARIYAAKISFKPEINHVYHLYLNEEDEHVLSMIGPHEWSKPKFKQFLYTVKLLADHTWEVLESAED
ncbi:MAG: DUF2452 domain-containing protein [Croceimicrobium sp.]|nr:DUF2452 domain-containing protein [Bacteroidota bacterium]